MTSNKKKAMLIGVDAVLLPLIHRFIKEGHLPNLKRLISEGSSSEAACCIPAWTPTNWANLATGSLPDTHGAANWIDSRVSDFYDVAATSTFDSRTITAESIWEAAERAGLKSMCAAYPSAYPKRTKNGHVIAPLHRGLVTLLMIRGNEYATEPKLPGGIKIDVRPATGWKGTPEGSLEAVLTVQEEASDESIVSRVGATEDGATIQRAKSAADIGTASVKGIRFDLLLINSKGQGYDRVLLCDNKDATKPVAELKKGEWSPWIIREYNVSHADIPAGGGFTVGFKKTAVDINGRRPGSTRFKLLNLSPDGKDIRLVRSEVYPTTNFTDPAPLSEELIREVGPYFEHPVSRLSPDVIERDKEILDTMLDEIRYQALWHPRAADYVMKNHGWDIYYLHWHWPDSIAHKTFKEIEPENPDYNPEKAEIYMDVVRRSYQIMDEMVGQFLKVADKDTYVVVVADHGCSTDFRAFSVQRLLEQKGLCVFKNNSSYSIDNIDFSNSRAYYGAGAQVTVNLKGRNPQGIVDPADYEKVQEEIIDALQTCRDPENGKLVVSFAMKKRDAQLFGFWGERTGDVVFLANHGYSWDDGSLRKGLQANPDAVVLAEPSTGQAHHGPSLPTDRTSVTSNMAAFLIKGPGIKAGYSRDPEKRGFVRLIDVVPTISELLGFKPPRQCEGAVLWDHLEE